MGNQLLAVGDKRERLLVATLRATEALEVYAALKARDPVEPGRRRKAEFEARLARLVRRYWAEQRRKVRQTLERTAAVNGIATKAHNPLHDAFGSQFWDEETQRIIAELTKLLSNAARDGVALFGETSKIGLDYTLVNKNAAQWARNYAYELVKGIDGQTRAALADAITTFIKTPGFTLADVMAQLPYTEQRAQRVGVTEITRAYAEGNQAAGERLKEEFPGVTVVKRWFTNRDGLVCPICAPLNNKVVEVEDEFVGGDGHRYQYPPAHPECRCWMTSTTRID